MNNFKILSIFILITLGFLAACKTEPIGELEQLIAKRDSMQIELAAIESKIIELDTGHLSQPALVTINPVKEGVFKHYIEIQGIVEADKNVMITAELPALIEKIHVKEGQKVKQGALLVTLDDESIKYKIEELKTQLKLAEFVYEKQANLRKENIGSELDYEKAKNKKEYLESALATARAQQGKTKIRAKYDGIVDEIFPKQGELTGPQMPLIRFVSLGKVNMVVDVPESYLNDIKQGDHVTVSFSELNKSYSSKITNRGNYIEPLNQTFKIKIDLAANDDHLLPNLIGVVKINDLTVENALLVNQDDILQDAKGDDFVFIIEEKDNKTIARKIFIEKGESYGDITYIKSGLKKSDRIISKGARSIIDGQEVQFTGIHASTSEDLTTKQ